MTSAADTLAPTRSLHVQEEALATHTRLPASASLPVQSFDMATSRMDHDDKMATFADHHSQLQQQVHRASRRRRRCWANGDTIQRRRGRKCGSGLPSSLLVVVSILATRFSGSEAGLAEFSLPYDQTSHATTMTLDSDGDLLVSGCAISTIERRAGHAVVFVAKYTHTTGEQLWRRELSRDGYECSSMFVATDASANVFIAGTCIVTSVSMNATLGDDASDMFVAKMSASGDIVWHKTIGSTQRDEATSITVDPSSSAVYVTGFSGGDLTQQKKSSSSVSNCVQWRSQASTSSKQPASAAAAIQECFAGVVFKLETHTGELLWAHQVVSQTSDRVFSVDVDGIGSVVVVGDTKGDLRNHSTPVAHASDLFVRKLDELTGEALWTTQLDSNSSAADLCRLPSDSSGATRRRGNCDIAVVSSSLSESSIYLTGTTFGVISTLAQDLQQYAELCTISQLTKQKTRFFETATDNTNDCAHQAMLAKVRLADGKVEWVRQVVSTARTSAEGIARLPAMSGNSGAAEDSVAVLGLADPGFMRSSSELFVLRATPAGGTQWLQETGLTGEALGIATGSASERLLLVMGVKNHDSSDNTVLQIQKLEPLTGQQLPFCQDVFSFQTNATSVQQLTGERVVVSATVERSNERCGGDSSVSFYVAKASGSAESASARPGVDFVATKSLVHFAARQKSITVAVIDVLQVASELPALGDSSGELVRTLMLVLQPSTQTQDSILQAPFTMEVTIQLATTVHHFPSPNGDSQSADGHFWRWLSRICALTIGLVLVLTVALGWLCGGLCGYSCLRKARVFQYTRIKSPRASNHGLRGGLDEPLSRRKSSIGALELSRIHSPRPSAHPKTSELELEAEEEDEKLRAHLSEIQKLNDSVDALMLSSSVGAQQRRRGLSANDEEPVEAELSTSLGVVTPILAGATVGPLSAAALATSGRRTRKKSRLLANLFPKQKKKKKAPSPT